MAQEQEAVDPRNAGSEGYRQDLLDINSKRACPFCPGPFYLKWHTEPILNENDRWLFTRNSHPYKGAQHHFLLILKRHKESLTDLSKRDLSSLLDLAKWATREFDLPGGGLAMRFGDTLHTGATVRHLHAHIIVPSVENGQVSPVYFPIG